MRKKPSPSERELRRAKALAAAEAEAASLRAIVRLVRDKGFRYAVAMKRVGFILPHSTLRDRLRRLERFGVEGLVDRRHAPPSRLTPEIRGFIEGAGRASPGLSVKGIIDLVAEQFKVDLKTRTIEAVLQEAGLARPQIRFTSEVQPAALRAAANPPIEEPLAAAGMAWLTVADDRVGYTAGLVEAVQELTQELPGPTPVTPEERENRDDKGRFLPEYNAPRERRDPEVGANFESVEVKRIDKDLARMKIVVCGPEILRAKFLALMALPMVTDCGRFDGATDVRGTWLAGLGWIDYMPATLDKFARELKYLPGASSAIQVRHAQIWYRVTAPWVGKGVCCSVLYVDTTVKPLWTDHFHKSGRVAMLGRVMPCVETVLINQGAGVPLLVQTFSGHQALTSNLFPLIDKLETAIGEGMLGRLTVIDGEMDCVALFKQFDLRHRLFIVPLDGSRVKDLSSIEGLRQLAPYRDGDSIGGGWVHLTDSQDPDAPPYRTRAIVLQRRTKKTFTVFGTSAPCEEFSDEELIDAYFSRWPKQEQIFRQLNAATSFKSAHGYGKQKVVNITVVDQMTTLDAQIERVEQKLQQARTEEKDALVGLQEATSANQEMQSAKKTLQAEQKRVARRHSENTRIHQLATSEAGEATSAAEVTKLKLKMATAHNKQALARTKKLEETLAEKKALSEVLASRREIYQTDVDLDQILSGLKTGFLLLLQYLIHTFFGSMNIDLMRFANQILLMPGVRIRTETTETVRFFAHRRNPEMMEALEEACRIFNALQHHHGGRLVRFELYWPPGTRDHAT